MTVKRAGLGRNLSALLGGVSPTHPIHSEKTVPSQKLIPGKYQPRRIFNQEALQELAQSIQQQGLLQPIVVRPLQADQYEILAGERRWRACQLAGVVDVPVIVKAVNDEEALVIALVENLQREDLTVLESARAMEQLMKDHALTHQQVADVLSKSRSAVTNHLRLLTLTPEVQHHLESGKLEMGHARALLMLDAEQQIQAGDLVAEKRLTVRATEALVERLKKGEPLEQPRTADMQQLEHPLVASLHTKVEIKPGRGGRGRLVIHYENEARLNSVLNLLSALPS